VYAACRPYTTHASVQERQYAATFAVMSYRAATDAHKDGPRFAGCEPGAPDQAEGHTHLLHNSSHRSGLRATLASATGLRAAGPPLQNRGAIIAAKRCQHRCEPRVLDAPVDKQEAPEGAASQAAS